MIRGDVVDLGDRLLLMVSLEIRVSADVFRHIPVLVDTANDCDLIMNRERLSELGLKFEEGRTIDVRGVHGRERSSVCVVDAMWDGEQREIRIVEGQTPALVGQGLLRDYSLYVEMRDGGAIVLQRLPSRGAAAAVRATRAVG